jgi:squalene-hopene/tetraprenyl-beta-curcumene cyclase
LPGGEEIVMITTMMLVGVMVSALRAPPAGEPLLDDTDRACRSARVAMARGLAYLAASQGEDGGWEAFGRPHPAITALVVEALASDSHYGPEHPAVRRGIEFVLRFAQPDGGIYVPDEGMRNYHTSVALLALSKVREPRCEEAARRARLYLKELQWDEEEGHPAASTWHGGQGYGKDKRPDLSNTQLMLEALKQSGLPPDDPAYRKAMVFVSRCQMLSETNDQPFARGADDGGFIYTPANDGESKAGTEVVEGQPRLRSYGSMTYAGFKSMLYAKVDRADVRVQRALNWIRRHYTLDVNPNMPDGQSHEGLYYYYDVFARALDAWGEEILVDAAGKPHRWRVELSDKLVSLQRPDGSWFNEEDRWFEGNPHLVTAYAIRALQTACAR